LGLVVNAATLKDQIKIALERGELSSFTTDIADHMGIERGLPYRALETQSDNTFRDFNVIIKDDKALCVILMVSSDTATSSSGIVYRMNLKGELEKVFTETGRFDLEHRPIRGSGVITDLELTPEVKRAFKRELDFWLKGRDRASAGVTPLH